MGHHSSKPMDDAFRQQMEIETQRMRLGASGKTPAGKLHDTDEGEIRFGVSHDPNRRKVIINFGKPVAWMAMEPEDAASLGQLLIDHSLKVRGIDP